MKIPAIFHRVLGLFIILAAGLALTPPQAGAQSGSYPGPSEQYSQEELAQMLAPIALYPDALLSQVLMASTYPIEVIEADRWVRLNPRLRDEALDAALLEKDWDPSVKAIAHFPSILNLMSERITETTELGNAFLAQEAEVMGTVQDLRAKAYAQGHLASTSQQQVIVEKQTIIIQPADPRIIYVPYYNPGYVYGPWWYPAYPPYYWGPPGVSISYGISYWPGFYFRVAFGTWSYFDWHRHSIYIDVQQRPRYVRHDRWQVRPGYWQHAPSHRRGVAYRDLSTARKYSQPLPRARGVGRETRSVSDQRPQNIERRGNTRIMIDRDQHEDHRSRGDRDRQERAERVRQERESADSHRQAPPRLDRNVQGQPHIERHQQNRTAEEARAQNEREQQQQGRRDQVERGERPERQASERGQGGRGRGRSGDDEAGRNRR